MQRAFSIYAILLVIALISAGVGAVSAKDVTVGTVTNVTNGTAVPVNITIHGANQVDTFGMYVVFDPTVMRVTGASNKANGWSITVPTAANYQGNITTGGYADEPQYVLTGDILLYDLTCQALQHDGSRTNITLVFDYVTEGGTDVKNNYGSVVGSFSTFDNVTPAVTITTPADGATVSQTVDVVATVTDVGGVDANSIVVSVGGVDVTPALAPIANGYTVTAQRTNVPLGAGVAVRVSASDLSGNSNATTHYVAVAEAGITFASPVNGTYTNETQPAILANFVKVDCNTIKMFLDGADVTASCSWTGVGPDGSIALNYTSYGVLADGAHHVVVNGTSTLVVGQKESAEVYFVKDTVAPVVSITGIDDSDGDGFPEAGELLCVDYTAIDANLDDVWFCTTHNTSRRSSGCIDLTIATGNRDEVAYASDLAGNVNSSAPVHIYNNNLAYFNDPSLGSFAGLNMSQTALYDVFSTAKAFTLTGPNSQMTAPTLGQLDKSIIGGSNVTFDNRKDDPIPAGSLPSAVDIYTTPSGSLDFAVTVPNVTNATLIVVKANSTLIDQLVHNPSKGSLTPSMVQELLDPKMVVIFGKEGYAIVNTVTKTFESVGTITVYPSDMSRTLYENGVNVSTGFNTATTSYGSTPLQISKLGQGEYVLLAVCQDDDYLAFISMATFEVTTQPGLLSTSAATYTIGRPVVVNSAVQGDGLSAVMINSASTYTGNVTLNFSTLGKDTFQSAYLLADGNQTVVKPYSKANLWLTEGYGNATAGRNATSVNVPTVGLLPGTYRVYMFLENEGNVTSYNETTVQLVPPGSIAVTSVPPGAAIYLDGTDTGVVTNGTLTDIPAGVYNVTVTLAGYSPASSSVTVAAGQTATVHFDMVPVPGCINVTSAPAGAAIYLDGTATGVVTNGTLTNVPVGNHTVTVTLSGYNSASSQVTVVTNQTTDVHFALTRTSSGGGGSSGGGSSGSTTSTFTSTGTLLTGSSGTVLKSVIVSANDDVGSLFIPIGTTALDANGHALTGISIDPLTGSGVPAVPTGSVFKFAGYAYECSPAGATFDPGITLTFTIPDDVWATLDPTNNQLSVMWYNQETGLWEELQATVNTGSKTVKITVTHFSVYALFTEPGTTPITPTETATTGPTVTTTSTTTPTGQQPSEGLPVTTILAIFAVVVIIAAAGYYFMMRK